MRKVATVRAVSPALCLVSIVAALLSVMLSTGSANGAIGYPGPIAQPGLPQGPSLGSIDVNRRGTTGWVQGFDDNSSVCYTINSQQAGCGTTESGKRSPYAFFYLAVFTRNHACPLTGTIYAQVTFDPGAQTGPEVAVHLGVNTLRVIGSKTINGVTTRVGIALPFTVLDPCVPPTSSTTTTTHHGGSTTTQPGGSTTTQPGGSTTTQPGGSTTTSTPTGSTTSTSIPNTTPTTSGPIGTGTVSPGIPYPSYDVNNQTPTQAAKTVTTVISIVAAAAAAAAAAAGASGALGGAGAEGGGDGGRGGESPEPIEPVDQGGEAGVAGEQPLDEGGAETGGDDGVTGEQPLDEGGAETGGDDGVTGEQPLDEGGAETGSGAEESSDSSASSPEALADDDE